nr:hypothetical protein [Candidatus Neomarinimicrobiota bacterium]
KLAHLLDLARPDYNLFYSPDDKAGEIFFKQIQRLGHEANGRFADPLFVDLQNGDVRLNPGSPALEMGIRSIDIGKIGLLNEPAFQRIKKSNIELF